MTRIFLMGILHSNLKIKALLALSKLKNTRAWNNETGVAIRMDGKGYVSYGLVGSSDIIGISGGKFLAVEIKIGKDNLKPQQIKFKEMIISLGGLYFEIRNEGDIENTIKVLSGQIP